MELAAEHQPGAHACADREEDEVLDALRYALPLLAEGGQVDVVLERDRQAEGALELEGDRGLGDARAAGDLGARDRRARANRVEHRALVQVAQKRRRSPGGRGHLVKEINESSWRCLELDSRRRPCKSRLVWVPNK